MRTVTEITQRQLRNDSGEIMRSLDRGERFVVTRNGVPVGELRPIGRRRAVPVDEVLEMFAGGSPIDHRRFRSDVDAALAPTSGPRF